MSTTTLAERTLAAEARAVEEGHHAIAETPTTYRVVSDTRPDKHYTVVAAVAPDAGVGAYFTCHPTGSGCYDDDHRYTSSPDVGHVPCKHAALVARRMARDGVLRWDAGRWVTSDSAAAAATARNVAAQPDDPFDGLPR